MAWRSEIFYRANHFLNDLPPLDPYDAVPSIFISLQFMKLVLCYNFSLNPVLPTNPTL